MVGFGCSCSCIGYPVVILDRSPLHLYSLEVVPNCSLNYPRILNFENTLAGVKTIFVLSYDIQITYIVRLRFVTKMKSPPHLMGLRVHGLDHIDPHVLFNKL